MEIKRKKNTTNDGLRIYICLHVRKERKSYFYDFYAQNNLLGKAKCQTESNKNTWGNERGQISKLGPCAKCFISKAIHYGKYWKLMRILS